MKTLPRDPYRTLRFRPHVGRPRGAVALRARALVAAQASGDHSRIEAALMGLSAAVRRRLQGAVQTDSRRRVDVYRSGRWATIHVDGRIPSLAVTVSGPLEAQIGDVVLSAPRLCP